MKFFPHTTGGYRQMATHETVKSHDEQFMPKMHKHGQDTAEMLRDLSMKDLSNYEGNQDCYA